MSKYILGHNDASLDATYSGGTWRTNLDSSMLNNNYLTAACKTLDLTGLTLLITLNNVIDAKVLGICNHNLSSSATYRWQCYSDSGRTTEVYDSGVITVYSYNEGISYKTICDRLDSSVNNTFWKLTITDSNSDGYIKIGRLFIGEEFELEYNMDYGLTHTISTNDTLSETSDFGVDVLEKRINKRGALFTHTLKTYQNGNDFFSMQLLSGITEEMIYEFNPDDKQGGLYTFICRNTKINPLKYPHYNINDMSLSIEELT